MTFHVSGYLSRHLCCNSFLSDGNNTVTSFLPSGNQEILVLRWCIYLHITNYKTSPIRDHISVKVRKSRRIMANVEYSMVMFQMMKYFVTLKCELLQDAFSC